MSKMNLFQKHIEELSFPTRLLCFKGVATTVIKVVDSKRKPSLWESVLDFFNIGNRDYCSTTTVTSVDVVLDKRLFHRNFRNVNELRKFINERIEGWELEHILIGEDENNLKKFKVK